MWHVSKTITDIEKTAISAIFGGKSAVFEISDFAKSGGDSFRRAGRKSTPSVTGAGAVEKLREGRDKSGKLTSPVSGSSRGRAWFPWRL